MPRRLSKKVRRGKRLRKSKKLSGGAAAPRPGGGAAAPREEEIPNEIGNIITMELKKVRDRSGATLAMLATKDRQNPTGRFGLILKYTPLGPIISFTDHNAYRTLFGRYIIALDGMDMMSHTKIVDKFREADEIIKVTVSDVPLMVRKSKAIQEHIEKEKPNIPGHPKFKEFLIYYPLALPSKPHNFISLADLFYKEYQISNIEWIKRNYEFLDLKKRRTGLDYSEVIKDLRDDIKEQQNKRNIDIKAIIEHRKKIGFKSLSGDVVVTLGDLGLSDKDIKSLTYKKLIDKLEKSKKIHSYFERITPVKTGKFLGMRGSKKIEIKLSSSKGSVEAESQEFDDTINEYVVLANTYKK